MCRASEAQSKICGGTFDSGVIAVGSKVRGGVKAIGRFAVPGGTTEQWNDGSTSDGMTERWNYGQTDLQKDGTTNDGTMEQEKSLARSRDLRSCQCTELSNI